MLNCSVGPAVGAIEQDELSPPPGPRMGRFISWEHDANDLVLLSVTRAQHKQLHI